MNDVSFNENKANKAGAIFAYDINIKALGNVSLNNNKALNGTAGAIYALNNITINANNLIGKYNNAKKDGGVFYSNYNNITVIEDIIFINNIAGSSAASGGAIYTFYNTDIKATNIIFANNTVANGGGAISTNYGNVYIKATNVCFINNVANTTKGGAIRSGNNVNIIATNVLFKNNNALEESGGAIRATNVTISANNIVFDNNSAYKPGSAIYAHGAVNITNAIFYGNATNFIYLGDWENSTLINNFWGLNYKNKTEIEDAKLISISDGSFKAPDYWILLNIVVPKEIMVNTNNPFKLVFNQRTNGTTIENYTKFKSIGFFKLNIDDGIVPEYVSTLNEFNVTPSNKGDLNLEVIDIFSDNIILKIKGKVVSMDSFLKVIINNCTYGEDVNVIIYLIGYNKQAINGKVNVTIDKTYTIDVIDGLGQKTIKNLNANTYNVIAKYNGDATHNNVTNSTTFKVAKKEVVLNANDLILYVGESGNLTITTSEVINGNVTVKYNSKSENVEIINGKGILEIGNLTVGSYDVNISLNTNPNYVAKNITSKIIVTQAFKEESNMTIDVNDAIFPNYNYVFINLTYANGTSISDYVHIYVYNLNGTLELYKKYFIEGTLNTTLPVYFPGIYNVVVSYKGNDTVNPSTKSAAFYLKKATVDMDLLLGSITYGETGVLSITASNNFTGTVKVFIDDEFVSDVKLKNGSGSIALENYDAGTYNVVVSYAGNKTHEAVNATTTWIVNRANIKINNITLNDIVYGETTPFIIELSENITDDFYLLINNQITMAKFINGVFNSNMTADAGTYGITILYLGNNNYNGVAQNLVWYVVQKPVNIELNITDITYGGDGILNIVTDNNLNETVSVFVNGNFIGFVTLNNGTASVILSGYNASQYKVGVWFTGSKNYKESDATTIWNVFQADTSFEINTENITTDEEEIITVYVGNNLTGVAIIKGLLDNSVSIRVVNGTGYVAISDLNRGTYNISGIFIPEDNNYNKAFNTSSFTVIDENIYIQISDLVKIYGTKDIFKAVLVNGEGKPLSYKKVTFTINGVSYTKETDLFGVASLNINLNAGEYPIKVTYGDIKEYATVYVVSTVKANDTTLMYKNGTKYEAIYTDSNGKVLANINVTFNINGVFYNKTTDSNGKASLAINLSPGEYTITTSNPVTGQSHSNKITVLPPLVGYDLSKTYGKEGAYKVEAYNNQGKPLANATVTINIHGVFYNKTTDVNGWAFLNINLQPGEYIATAYLNGYATSNKITVVEA